VLSAQAEEEHTMEHIIIVRLKDNRNPDEVAKEIRSALEYENIEADVVVVPDRS
jgi:hypothetical protein